MSFATELVDDLCSMLGLILSRAAMHTPVHLGCSRYRSKRTSAPRSVTLLHHVIVFPAIAARTKTSQRSLK